MEVIITGRQGYNQDTRGVDADEDENVHQNWVSGYSGPD